MCMTDWAEPAVVLHSREQRARITHRCGECGRTINIGETYRVERLVCDGDASSHKTCQHCISARGWLNHHCHGWVYGAVADDIGEHFYRSHENSREVREVRLLYQGIRARWERADGRLWPVPPSVGVPT